MEKVPVVISLRWMISSHWERAKKRNDYYSLRVGEAGRFRTEEKRAQHRGPLLRGRL